MHVSHVRSVLAVLPLVLLSRGILCAAEATGTAGGEITPKDESPRTENPTVAPPEEAPPTNKPLRLELLRMVREDQESAVETSRPSDPGDPEILARSGRIHGWNGTRIKQIVAEHGWPGKTLVGADGAHAAWLIVQHADEDRDFQKRCLELMRQAFTNGDVSAYEIAYLTDRILGHEGKPQMYGTQGGGGVTSPEDEARFDANRQTLGLEPWKDFIKRRRELQHAWLPEIEPDGRK